MDSPRSGSPDKTTKLLHLETDLFLFYLSGKPFHPTVKALKLHRDENGVYITSHLSVHPHHVLLARYSARVFSPEQKQLIPFDQESVAPLFFETQSYTLSIVNKLPNKHVIGFQHDHQHLQNAIHSHDNLVLSGTLTFGNDVGLTDLHITVDGAPGLTLQLEIFPAKLDYKSDYDKILQDVNEQIYNLSFDFMKRTYHLTGLRDTQNQTLTEYFTILRHIFRQLVVSVERINDAPHHKLQQELQVKDAARVKKAGKTNLKFLTRNHRYLVQDSINGMLTIKGHSYRPDKLIESKKQLSYDTTENRFLRWTLERIDRKLKFILDLMHAKNPNENQGLKEEIRRMQGQLRRLLQFDFLREAGTMQQVSITLVLQMSPGYRDAYRLYLMLLKGLAIQSDLFHISLKDLSLLYEYWCFLKINYLLSKKYKLLSQDVIKVKHTGLFVTLDRSRSAKMVYEHPSTREKFELYYNNVSESNKADYPTVYQRPDTVLTITKTDTKEQSRVYKYVFDAKYRIDPAYEGTAYHKLYDGIPGPLEEDINTMHRYRDAIVYQEQGATAYERSMFGAYVLFPYGNEQRFQDHKFYRSIELINIGAFPFLPNATDLLEKFLDELILDSPEKAFVRATVPRGAEKFYQDKWRGKNAMVIPVRSWNLWQEIYTSQAIELPLAQFERSHKSLKQIERIALYRPVAHFGLQDHGIHYSGTVTDWQVVRREEDDELMVRFWVEAWKRLTGTILPGQYNIQHFLLTSTYLLDHATSMAELWLTEEAHLVKWRELRRQGLVVVELDHTQVDLATGVKQIGLRGLGST